MLVLASAVAGVVFHGGAALGEPPADPRIPLIEHRLDRNPRGALQLLERTVREDPEAARELGLDYLRGHLLLELGRRQEALEAFATTMGTTPELGAYSRFRLAVEQEAHGHPEVAAGLVATLLGSDPPSALVAPAVRLLEDAIFHGGDCRLLHDLRSLGWGTEGRRRLTLVRAECAAREGDGAAAGSLLRQLLEEERGDHAARVAAEMLAATRPEREDARTHLLLGLAFYEHREFDTAIYHLARAMVQLGSAADVSRREAFECRYALARSHFWLGRYEPAAAVFEALAKTTDDPTRRAQVLYQRARSFELAGRWEQAVPAFQLAYQTQPAGRWADAALIAALRLLWLQDREDDALEMHRALVERRFHGTASRALLFLAASDLVSGRADRADGWLADAARLDRVADRELDYWNGRLEELRGRRSAAVERYARVLGDDPHHPFGGAARRRLATPELAPSARALGRRLAGSDRPEELRTAWRLLGDGDPGGQRARRRLEELLSGDGRAAPYLRLTLRPAPEWPLWRAPARRPEEMLLALGLFAEGSSSVLRHFPVTDPSLAFTGSVLLSRAGEHRRSIYVAEILAKRLPDTVPAELLPPAYRQLLYPFGYSYLFLREAARRDVDPYLLAAIVREESRFDPHAFSGASARGLTQFVFPTATRIAATAGLGAIAPRDLERPEVAITLGAAYLQELLAEFDGAVHQAIAAYNAGEPQAALWRRYCLSDEREEYLTKVAFRETRRYLEKVLTSRQHYTELYGPEDTASAARGE